jgi:hypothetical protein
MADEDEDVGGSNADPYSVLAANLGGPEKAALMLMKQRQAGVNAQQQKLMDMMQQQESPLSQTGMSDYQKAAMMFQAAGALAKPTRSGGLAGLMENIGGAGEALAGPLSKADEAQRARQQQLQQLQLARQKLGIEMSGQQGVSPSDLMALVKSTRDNEEEKETFKKDEVDGKPVLVGSRGTIKPFDYKMAGLEPRTAAAAEDDIPQAVRVLGPEGIKKYKERIGTKIADDAVAAEQTAESAQMVAPILKRAEEAYKKLHEADAIGPIQGNKEGWSRWVAARVGTTAEQDRQDYEQALADLELWRSAKLKGQGAITNFERNIIASSLPRLDAVNATPGFNTFKSLNRELQFAMEKPSRVGGKQSKQTGVIDFGDLK